MDAPDPTPAAAASAQDEREYSYHSDEADHAGADVDANAAAAAVAAADLGFDGTQGLELGPPLDDDLDEQIRGSTEGTLPAAEAKSDGDAAPAVTATAEPPVAAPKLAVAAAASSSSSPSAASSASAALSPLSAYFHSRSSATDNATEASSPFKEQQRAFRAAEVRADHAALASHLHLCDHCNHATCSVSCAQCKANYCDACFGEAHLFVSKRAHERIPMEGAMRPASARPSAATAATPHLAPLAEDPDEPDDAYADDLHHDTTAETSEPAAVATATATATAAAPPANPAPPAAVDPEDSYADDSDAYLDDDAATVPAATAAPAAKPAAAPAAAKPAVARAVSIAPASSTHSSPVVAAATAALSPKHARVASKSKSPMGRKLKQSQKSTSPTRGEATQQQQPQQQQQSPPSLEPAKSVVGGATAARVAEMAAKQKAQQLLEWQAQQDAAAALAAQAAADAKALKRATVGFPETRLSGVLEHVYTLLQQDDSNGGPPALGGFRLPLTVIFHNSAPFSSMITDARGYIQQQHWGATRPQNIVADMMAPQPGAAPTKADDTVAIVYSMAPNVDAQTLNAGQLHSLFGLVADPSLEAAPKAGSVQPSRPKGNFIVQKYIRPAGRTAILYRVQASWVDGAANDAPLQPGQGPRLALTECSNTQSALCTKSRTGRAPVETNVPVTGYEGSVFKKLVHGLRRSVTSFGLGTPIRLSAYCTYAEEDASGAGDQSALARMKWYFCFADLLQLNSVDRGVDGMGEARDVTQSVLDEGEAKKPSQRRKKKSVAVGLVHKHLDRSSCAKCCRVFRSPSEEGQGIMLKQVLLKWVPNRLYEYPENLFDNLLGIDERQGVADWTKCVVSVCMNCLDEIRALKTIPARTQLAPWLAAAAAEEAAASASAANSNGSGSGNAPVPAASPKASKSSSSSAASSTSPGGVVLPYLSRAPVLHPDGSGFSALLVPPQAQRSLQTSKLPMSALVGAEEDARVLRLRERNQRLGAVPGLTLQPSLSSPALLQAKKHPIAGGSGTAPREPHHPKSRHHRKTVSNASAVQGSTPFLAQRAFAASAGAALGESSYAEEDDAFDSESASPSHARSPSHQKQRSGALPSLTGDSSANGGSPLSPYSSGRAKPASSSLQQQSASPTNAAQQAERAREKALAKALAEARANGTLYTPLFPASASAQSPPPSQGGPGLRGSKSHVSLTPLSPSQSGSQSGSQSASVLSSPSQTLGGGNQTQQQAPLPVIAAPASAQPAAAPAPAPAPAPASAPAVAPAPAPAPAPVASSSAESYEDDLQVDDEPTYDDENYED